MNERETGMKAYTFVTADGTDCRFEIVGEYRNCCADVAVCCGGYQREWDEVDGGSVDEMFADLMDHGVRFESKRSLMANVMVVTSVMLDRDLTLFDVLNRIDALTDAEVEAKYELHF